MPDTNLSETKKIDTSSDAVQQKEASRLPKMGFGPYEREGPSPVMDSDSKKPLDQGDLSSVIKGNENALIEQARSENRTKLDNQELENVKDSLFGGSDVEKSQVQKLNTNDLKQAFLGDSSTSEGDNKSSGGDGSNWLK